MARTTKKTTKAAETKAATPVVETVAETPVVETVVETPVEKKEVKKAPAKKTTAKKAAVKEEVKVEEAALTVNVTLQFAEKSYTEESLTAIAKDVWTYDLNKDAAELKTVELYVKPEEGLCYYVFNGDVTGSFVI